MKELGDGDPPSPPIGRRSPDQRQTLNVYFNCTPNPLFLRFLHLFQVNILTILIVMTTEIQYVHMSKIYYVNVSIRIYTLVNTGND